MVSYLYRCSEHGCFEIRLPIGDAGSRTGCPDCGAAARRVYSAPRLAFANRDRMAVIDHAERSAESPEVVSAPAPRRHRRPNPALVNPNLYRLPRP